MYYMSEQDLNNDIRELIVNTIQWHDLGNLEYHELIKYDIINWVYLIVSQVYTFKSKKIKNTIKKYLRLHTHQNRNKNYITVNTSPETIVVPEDNPVIDSPIEISFQNQPTKILANQNVINEDEFTNLPIDVMTQRMNKLSQIILPEQRSLEWYLMRHNMITASDLYKVLGPPGGRRELLIKKSSPIDPHKQKSGGGDACKHGVKFEPIATSLYELRNKVKVLEFGCIPHFDRNFPFGASPDGICSLDKEYYAGRMLEIKCPYSRQINGVVPEMYWKQVQGQLEVCDLEVCDFLECKITEYDTMDSFYQDGDDLSTADGLEKGAIIVYSDLNNNYSYIYPQIGLGKSELLELIDLETDKILDDPNKNYVTICWWKLEVYSCILIKRDREWFSSITPKIYSFWEEVEKYRVQGNDILLKQKKIRKKKNKNINPLEICLINSDDESK